MYDIGQYFSHLWDTIFLTHGAPLSGLYGRGSSAMTALEWQLSTDARSENRLLSPVSSRFISSSHCLNSAGPSISEPGTGY